MFFNRELERGRIVIANFLESVVESGRGPFHFGIIKSGDDPKCPKEEIAVFDRQNQPVLICPTEACPEDRANFLSLVGEYLIPDQESTMAA